MSEKIKYNDEDTKKEGSPIETPYKHSDHRNALKKLKEEEERSSIKDNK